MPRCSTSYWGRPATLTEEVPPNGIKLAMLDGYLDRLGAGVDTALAQALDALAARGTRVSTQSIPHALDIAPVYLHLVLADAAALHVRLPERRPHAHTPNVRLRLEMGRHVLGEDYVRAQHGRAVLRREIDRALDGVDALVLPALSIEAPPIGAVSVAVAGGTEPVRTAMLRCTQPFNLSGHPAISLPAGRPRADCRSARSWSATTAARPICSASRTRSSRPSTPDSSSHTCHERANGAILLD